MDAIALYPEQVLGVFGFGVAVGMTVLGIAWALGDRDGDRDRDRRPPGS